MMDTYEKKYKEALERAKKELGTCGSHDCDAARQIFRLFPELKESEDEKIRKELIEHIKANKDADYVLFKKFSSDDVIAWLEKQGEQKSADKVEPKFHEGDWAVSNLDGKARQISEIHFDEYNSYYVVDGKSVNLEEYDRLHHLWSIADAKDGDVLAYVTDEEDLWIMIYWSLYKPYEGHVHYHALLVNNDFSDKGTCCICIDDLKPATKEQRDTLIAKMTEAGYEWDAEKKELRKIEKQGEQKPTLRERYKNITQSEWFKRTHNGMSVSDEEPKWTKEDDERQISITEYLNELYDDNRFSLDELTDLETWLKSLKQRIEQ